MNPWWAGTCGVLGGITLELLELHAAVRKVGKVPWKEPGEPTASAFLVSVGIRVFVGGVFANLSAASGEICNEVAAYISGIAAPILIMEKLPGLFKGKRDGEE